MGLEKAGVLALGQLISVLIALSGIFNDQLTKYCGETKPASQTMFVYVILAFSLVGLCSREKNGREGIGFEGTDHGRRTRSDSRSGFLKSNESGDASTMTTTDTTTIERYPFLFGLIRLHLPWQTYMILAVLDVLANYVLVLSYNYTSIFSVVLISTCSTAWVMVISKLIFRRKYTNLHFFGCFLAMLGTAVTIIADYRVSNTDGHGVLGDALVFFGTMLYALNNVFFEWAVKRVEKQEYLSMLGLFGACFSLAIVALFERSVWIDDFDAESCTKPRYFGLYFGFVLSLVAFYALTTIFMEASEATLFNLSLLTVIIYVIIFEFIKDELDIGFSFIVSTLLVILGVSIYEKGGPPIDGAECSAEESEQNVRVGRGEVV